MIPTGLAALEAQLTRDLASLGYPLRDWVPAQTVQGKEVLEVLVIGGGQSGLSVAAALMREKVRRVLVVDAKPQGKEGPWKDFARMVTLRTPKHVTGPDLGLPHLTFQAWYEAQYGVEGWAAVKLIPKELWADYLAWYRRVLALPVRNGVSVAGLERSEAGVWRVSAATEAGPETFLARKVVLATGIDGAGRWETPAVVRSVPKRFWAHTNEAIDFQSLKGKAVGVLGAGASAFDNASVALESGAASVDLFFRRKRLVDINPYRWAEFTGFLKHHADLGDDLKWKFIVQFLRMGQLPPADTLARAQASPGFQLHPGAPWSAVQPEGDRVRVTTSHSSHLFDFLILGTGFVTDLSLRPELALFHDKLATWADRYSPPAGWESEDLGRHPYLGPSGEFLPKDPADTWVSSVYCYTFAGLPSLGFAGASISGLKYSLPKLVDGITRELYREHAEHFFETLRSYDAKEF